MSGAPAACQGAGVGGPALEDPPSTRGGHGLEQEVHGAQGLDSFLEIVRQLRVIATQFVHGDAPALLPELLPAQQEIDVVSHPTGRGPAAQRTAITYALERYGLRLTTLIV